MYEQWSSELWNPDKGHIYTIKITGREKGIIEDGLQGNINYLEEYLEEKKYMDEKQRKYARILLDETKKLQRELREQEKRIK